jgi:protein O-mannosyl-transferase
MKQQNILKNEIGGTKEAVELTGNDRKHNETNASGKQHSRISHFAIMAGLAAITILALTNSLFNQITVWDDTQYIRDNPLVKNLSWAGVTDIFANPVMGNYHPLTILSYCIEYHFAGLEPLLYHYDSLLLHVLVVLLVYWFAFRLTRSKVAAIITSILFGLHPMHVESVAWISARKDLLYSFFYVAACILYLGYLRTHRFRKAASYAGVLFLFLCAVLCKPVAVSLPLVLLMIDYFERRRFSLRLIAEKTPHFLIAVTFGVMAVKTQQSAGAMDMIKESYGPLEKIAFAGYELSTYLYKSVLPINLHAIYPYPARVNGNIPTSYFVFPVAIAALIIAIWKFARQNRTIVFGMLFFAANIALVLQFISVGDAIMAERYTYLPYFGLFFIAGNSLARFYAADIKTTGKWTVGIMIAVYCSFLGYASSDRCKVWSDDISLWRDQIEKVPGGTPNTYNNLGYLYYIKWGNENIAENKTLLYDSVRYFLNMAIKLEPAFVNPYLTLGKLAVASKNYDEAKKTYTAALKYNPNESNLFIGLAEAYFNEKNMDSCGYYIKASLLANPSSEAHGNYAIFLENNDKPDSALAEYGRAIALSPASFLQYLHRGQLYKRLNQWSEALNDLNYAIQLNPDIGESYYARSFCDTQQGRMQDAVTDIKKALSLGFEQIDTAYYNKLLR